MAAANKTIDHREIRRWVERHGGQPAAVKRTRGKGEIGMIRVDFPGFSGEGSLEAISWDEWFQKFDEQKLAFLYQDGKNTNFNKLVRRDEDEVRPSDRRRGPSRTTRGGRAAARALRAEGARSKGTSQRRSSSTRSTGGTASTRGSTTRAAGRGRNGATSTRKQGAQSRGGRASARRSGTRPTAEMTKAELYGLARSAGVPNRSTMSKSQLLRALERH